MADAPVRYPDLPHAPLMNALILGLGVPPNRPSWGNLLTEARSHLLTGEWYTVAVPAAAVVATIIAVNVVAGALSGPSEGRAW